MGNFANEQELITANNLPSRRWKNRRIRTARDKRLRSLDKEHTRVWNQIRDLGYEKLEPPVQRGYKRLFVLTEETKKSHRAEFYQTLLNKINTVVYSPHKVFKTKKRRIRKWKYVDLKEQKLQEPGSYHFHYKDNFTEEEKKLFYPVEYYCSFSKTYYTKYVFMEQWRFVLRIRPNMITEIRIKDHALEKYRDELGDFLDRTDNHARLIKLRGGYSYSWKKVEHEKEDRKKYSFDSLTNIPLHQILETYNKEKKLLWE